MNKTTDSKLSQAILVIPVSVVLGFAIGLFQAYVISQIWGWFAVGRLGMPHIPVLVAYGLLIGANITGITGGPGDAKGETALERMIDVISTALFRTLMGWLMAYIVYCLM